MKSLRTFNEIEDRQERSWISDEYKNKGYSKIYSNKSSYEEKAEGLRMVIEVYYDQLVASRNSGIPTFPIFAAHFINAQRGRYDDAVLDILEKEFGTIDEEPCIRPGGSSWNPRFQQDIHYRNSVLPKLTEEQNQKIRRLQ